MRAFTKSVMSYTWALSVFSVQQAINLLQPAQGSEQTAKAKQAFDRVTDATTGTFDQALQSMFGAGDKLQQQMVEVVFSGMSGGGLVDPGRWVRMGSDAMKQMVDMGRGVVQGANPAANAPQPTSPAPPDPQQDAGWGPMPGQ